MGVPVEKHHHEVAPSQHELGMKFGTLIETADNLQLYKYAVHQVANAYGVSATLCRSPLLVITDPACMCTNQSGQKESRFYGNQYADLSENALFYIGGIIKHAKSLNIHQPVNKQLQAFNPGL